MSSVEPKVWQRVAELPVPERGLRATQAVPNTAPDLIAAIDANASRHFLLLVPADHPVIVDRGSRGIVLDTLLLEMPGNAAQLYLDLSCTDASGHDVFDVVGFEIATRLAGGKETPAEIVQRVLAKWRRFWGESAKGMLAREAQIGLFCELLFLYRWLIPAIGAAEALSRWRGPFRSRHDFEWSSMAIEVKGTSLVDGLVHHISGLDQLEPPEGGRLFLFSVKVREEASSLLSLPALISRCREAIAAEPQALDLLEAALAAAHYHAVYEPEYDALKLRVIAEALFEVTPGFPKLTKEELRQGQLPSGVGRVEYLINLDAAATHRLATEPEQAYATFRV